MPHHLQHSGEWPSQHRRADCEGVGVEELTLRTGKGENGFLPNPEEMKVG